MCSTCSPKTASRVVQFLSSLPRLWRETATIGHNTAKAVDVSEATPKSAAPESDNPIPSPPRRFFMEWMPRDADIKRGRYPKSDKTGVVLFPADLIDNPVKFIRLEGQTSSVVLLSDKNAGSTPICPYLELEIRVVGAENRYIQWREGGEYYEGEK